MSIKNTIVIWVDPDGFVSFLTANGDLSRFDGLVIGGSYEDEKLYQDWCDLLYRGTDEEGGFSHHFTQHKYFPHKYYYPEETAIIVSGFM